VNSRVSCIALSTGGLVTVHPAAFAAAVSVRILTFGSASTLAVAVGEERETVEEVAEPFLVRCGLLARTPRGRVATAAGWAHLGLEPPPSLTELPTLFD